VVLEHNGNGATRALDGRDDGPAGQDVRARGHGGIDRGLSPEGDHICSFEFTPTGKPDIPKGKGVPAKIKLFVDGKEVGRGDLPVTIPLMLSISAGVSLGANSGSPVMEDYESPFAFTGTVKKALVDITGETIEDKAAQVKIYLARQ
jgi:arylsulfatase